MRNGFAVLCMFVRSRNLLHFVCRDVLSVNRRVDCTALDKDDDFCIFRYELAYLVGHIDAEVLHVLKKYDLDADVHYEGLLPDAVRAVHEVGQQVNVWTVNQPKIATKMAAMGVDFITTDILE